MPEREQKRNKRGTGKQNIQNILKYICQSKPHFYGVAMTTMTRRTGAGRLPDVRGFLLVSYTPE